MSTDRDLLGRIPPPALAATVASCDQATQTCMVRVDRLDDGALRHGPCPYVPIALGDGSSTVVHHPRRGDRCVVVEDDRGHLWITCWTFHG